MPIDLSTVDWLYVAVLSVLAFVAALLGSLISFRNRFSGAILAGFLFAAGFVFWTYYPHPNIPGPTRLESAAAAPAKTAAPSTTPVSPVPNPVTTVNPAPANPEPTSPAPSGVK